MLEGEHFTLPEKLFPPEIFPHIFTQTRAISERNGVTDFLPGGEVNYSTLNMTKLSRGLCDELIDLIYKEVEVPSFAPEDKTLVYGKRVIRGLMEIKGGLIFLAWKKGRFESSPKLVGYLIAAPYQNYPSHFRIHKRDITTPDGRLLSKPDRKTLFLDTLAVEPCQRGQKIGATLVDIMLSTAFAPRGPLDKLVTFAVDHPSSYTREILLKHPHLKDVDGRSKVLADESVRYCQSKIYGHYMLFGGLDR